jgi:hypothetical protein
VVAKENRFYFLAGRLPPPSLSEVSTARLASGQLPTSALVRALDEHDCALLVYANSLDGLAPGLRAEADGLYSLELEVSDEQDNEPISVFTVPIDTQTPPATPLVADLGGQIQITGFDLTPGPWTSGQTVYLSTYWRTRRPPATDYRLFVHLVDGQGQLVQAADHFPFELNPDHQISNVDLNPLYLAAHQGELPSNYPNAGLLPTHLWRPGATLKETSSFALAPDLPAGNYTVQVGMFDPVTGERLDVDDAVAGGVDNQIVLATVAVQ